MAISGSLVLLKVEQPDDLFSAHMAPLTPCLTWKHKKDTFSSQLSTDPCLFFVLFFSTHKCRRVCFCVPVHIRSSLLQHGLFSFLNLIGVQDVKEVDRHVERHGNILPHGVGHVIVWVDGRVLTRQEKKMDSSEPPN